MLTRRRFAQLAIATPLAGCGAPFVSLISRGERQRQTLSVAGARVDLEVGLRGRPLPLESFETWVERAVTIVSEYFGRAPHPILAIGVVTGMPGAVRVGFHNRGRGVTVMVGADVTPRALERDPILVHELCHAAFPYLARRHRWMREGLSTYLETTLRARADILEEAGVWRRFARGMPNGLTGPRDRGLDLTPTWGRTYWGGAMFWMVVDVELRRAGRSLRDALRHICLNGGDARELWTTARVCQVGDEGTSSTVLRDLYLRHARARTDVDLAALFAELGVSDAGGGEVALDDSAPLAEVRRAIAAPAGYALPPVPS